MDVPALGVTFIDPCLVWGVISSSDLKPGMIVEELKFLRNFASLGQLESSDLLTFLKSDLLHLVSVLLTIKTGRNLPL